MSTMAIDPRSILGPLPPAPPRESAAGERPARIVDDRTAASIDPHLVSLLSPTSFEAAQYRVLCHRIEQLDAERERRVLAVCAPGSGEGKTTTSINLAATLARTPGCDVLLIDADLRRPMVAPRLGLRRGLPGLADLLRDPALALEGVVRRRLSVNLAVLPAGRCTEDPYELLHSPRLGEILAAARQRFQRVVIDTPPLLPVPDWRLLDPWVDGFLLVVAAHRTPRKLLEESLNAMRPDQLVGMVFNADDGSLSRYYRRYSGYYDRAPAGPARSGA
jgi:capsular exopolysaccharide synthesis family protein